MKALFALVLMAGTAMAGERATIVVCPPTLSYCYHDDKPVLPQIKADDYLRDFYQRMADRKRRNDAELQRSFDSLGYELSRGRR